MGNIFSMVTLKRSQIYTSHALESFFKNTEFNNDDRFLLIDNDNCQIDQFKIYEKIEVIKNRYPLSFAKNVNQAVKIAIKENKNLIFLNNDIIFTKYWFKAIKSDSKNISIPVNNQIFPYQSDCGKLKLKITMDLDDFNNNHFLLEEIAKKHYKKYNNSKNFQGLLMPFFCFKVPIQILKDVGLFDTSFVDGAEDVDYRIRCAIKGYEVNFLINSYLLHFHGKSTWDGGETKDQINNRNKLYTETFLKKWGEEMTQIFILRKKFMEIIEKKNLLTIFKSGNFRQLIIKLLN
tara:strand:+ start:30 stop:902 length:873 start_codon:yes stop_codon:yes gene_type:complete